MKKDLTVVSAVEDLAVEGGGQGAWMVEDAAGGSSTSVAHQRSLGRQEIHGFKQEACVCGQSIAGQQELKRSVLQVKTVNKSILVY